MRDSDRRAGSVRSGPVRRVKMALRTGVGWVRSGLGRGDILSTTTELVWRYLVDLGFLVKCVAFGVLERLTRGRRDDTLWVFGARGGHAFADNAKYCYLSVAADCPDVRPAWISHDRAVVRELRANGFRAHHAWSPAGIWANLRAGVVVLTQGIGDVNLACSGGALVADLWHGIPLKTISWDAEFPSRPLPFRLGHRYLAGQVDLLAIPGPGPIEAFESGLRIDRGRMAETGYPRTDALFDPIEGEHVGLAGASYRTVERLAADATLVFYLPTFRHDVDGSPADHLDFERLDAFLADRDAFLVVKPHPAEPIDLGAHDRLVQLPAETDVYPFLRHADVLLTDYSSVFFDFLVLDRPLVFYPYDLERYRERRGLYFSYEAVTPGPIATDFESLLTTLEGVLAADEYAAERQAVRERFLADPSPERSAAVIRAIRARLGR